MIIRVKKKLPLYPNKKPKNYAPGIDKNEIICYNIKLHYRVRKSNFMYINLVKGLFTRCIRYILYFVQMRQSIFLMLFGRIFIPYGPCVDLLKNIFKR